MISVELQPCRIDARSVLVCRGQESQVLDWESLLGQFSASKSDFSKRCLLSMRPGSFVGLVKDPKEGTPRTFLLNPHLGKGRIDWLLEKDPSFADRVIKIFRVRQVKRTSRVEENS